MKRGHLSELFSGIVMKRLSAVETAPQSSNQHEFNGSAALRRLLGDDDRKNIETRFLFLGQEQEAVEAEGAVSWYDARRKHPTRTEYRLYYPENDVTGMMAAGDIFFLAMGRDGTALIVVTPAGSTMENQLRWLFGLEDEQPQLQFTFQPVAAGSDAELDFAARAILELLNIDPEEPASYMLDALIEPFGMSFPTTKVISELARTSLPDYSAFEQPDDTLVAWMDREEQLFRRLERRIVAERIGSGFIEDGDADIDGFLKFSLSVQNRRKSRAGQALENHLEALFTAHGIRYARGAETENRNRPDFLFPGQAEYHDAAFPSERLTMLGAKSSLKDRWRQVLSEAERIGNKHLLTLEPGISENQTDEMREKKLQLVVPKKIRNTYRLTQQMWIITVAEFIALARTRQSDKAVLAGSSSAGL